MPSNLIRAAHDFERRARVVGHQSLRQRLALERLGVGQQMKSTAPRGGLSARPNNRAGQFAAPVTSGDRNPGSIGASATAALHLRMLSRVER